VTRTPGMSVLANLEETHFMAPKVFVFDIPKPAAGTLGYRAADWPKTAMWTGRLRVASKGDKLFILLEHTDKDGLFASCPVNGPNVVEKVTDSSRYFSLRISDGKGRHAVIGLGFQEREQAFDFKVAMQDFENRNKAPDEKSESGPAPDFTLPEGGKIHVNLPGKREGGGGDNKKPAAASGALAILAPPPTSGKQHIQQQPQPKKSEAKDASAAVADIFGLANLQIEGAPKPQPQQQQQTVQPGASAQTAPKVTTTASSPNDWVTFE